MTEAITPRDLAFVRRAVELALAAEAEGNLPIGAVLARGEEVIAEGGNEMLVPGFLPGNHAEVVTLRRAPPSAWEDPGSLTCYSTLEPCVMCTGTLLLHGVGRVVFGATDPGGGGGVLLPHLPPYYAGGKGVPEWLGPVLPELCDPLYLRALARFQRLPCAVTQACAVAQRDVEGDVPGKTEPCGD